MFLRLSSSMFYFSVFKQLAFSDYLDDILEIKISQVKKVGI